MHRKFAAMTDSPLYNSISLMTLLGYRRRQVPSIAGSDFFFLLSASRHALPELNSSQYILIFREINFLRLDIINIIHRSEKELNS